ncbi:interferon gamma receptor 1 [Clarias gariepinus]|uniref:interferon gamma receptor 1 n=1 Tax=Clarias gariepinus TaxID=13013 RepID=UPI00234D052D|nr:interferon gamma receptor 1 [Clarias gariepinus]
MRAPVLRILETLTVLTVLSRSTHSTNTTVPPPSNVIVTCNSYGVEVEWTATNLSEKAEFLLEVKQDFGIPIPTKITKYHRFNISDLLQDTGYNRYLVKVKAIDGGRESVFAESQIFSFSYKTTATIFCDLEFPTVTLFPRDGNLFVKFVNPLHLYRDTPALRNLLDTDKLKYTLISGKISKNATCSVEERECESSVSFPEEQEEYCITLSGWIRQTRVQGTELYCYSETLNPGPPVISIVIPVLVVFLLFLLLSLATVFLVIFLSKKIKKENLSMFPQFLEDISTHTPLITPNSEPVAKNPRVEPTGEIPSNKPCDLQESTTQLETSANSGDLSDRSENEDMYEGSGSTGVTSVSPYNQYGYRDNLSSSECLVYDRGHVLLEMSPGDLVKNYG